MSPFNEFRSPVLAFCLGFFCGGIGLMLYFRTWEDFFVIACLMIAISIGLLPVGGPLWACIIVGIYGFLRAQSSNQKLGVG